MYIIYIYIYVYILIYTNEHIHRAHAHCLGPEAGRERAILAGLVD